MRRAWLIVGLAAFCIGGLGWFVSVILNVITLGQFRVLSNIFASIAITGVFLTIIGAVLYWKKQ